MNNTYFTWLQKRLGERKKCTFLLCCLNVGECAFDTLIVGNNEQANIAHLFGFV